MKIKFLGATETVTGSKYLISLESNKNILVDCGLFQGHKELRLRNWAKLPISPKMIDAVILTHAHIDHTGYIPLLVKNGFEGKIYCTHGTKDLCEILLPDCGYLQEEEAAYANTKGYSKHAPALPLYTYEDAVKSLDFFSVCEFHKEYTLFDNFTFKFNHAGHIIGASTALLKYNNTSILFSGDLGRPHDPMMLPPEIPSHVDYLVMESTYGNRTHEKENPLDSLEKIILSTIKRGGSIIIPAFAVGRVQLILYFIYQLKAENRIPNIPVFLDSPMATNATELFCRYSKEHRLDLDKCREIFGDITYIHKVTESKELDILPMPKIIVSSSGMATGGRILHHLKAFAPDHRNSIIFTGFQAPGTRGDRIVNGERAVKMLGEMVDINAEVFSLGNTSAHADKNEILEWLKQFKTKPRKVFITHGEITGALSLKETIEKTLGWPCIIPKYLHVEVI